MDATAQRKACQTAKLFSRVEPAHKSKIIDYLQKDGAVSAMVSVYMSVCVPVGIECNVLGYHYRIMKTGNFIER